MVCQVCHQVSSRWLCSACAEEMRSAPDMVLPGGIRLVAAFEHTGPARTLIHHLKYRGIVVYADLVASVLASRLPSVAVVPVPRALSRRWRYGVDPSRVIAGRLAKRLGVPVWDILVGPLHNPRRAGGDHSRPAPTFRMRRPPGDYVIVVDDVVTTGATLLSALGAFQPGQVAAAASANAVAQVSSLPVRYGNRDP
ncbi:MAG: ComF family protein [Acidimicrobiia bacterium]